ncbi:hypothetical protein AWC01_05910 [Mycobacterium doricum]|uniref:Uncharacterized protein n=1 Tax=Mycolicibacterium doricum TaxID=126673 RepID=A0A1X1TG00_9MYCO|nr:hypothetical protein AWC01_05910 [Mycolicibacterium doricum]
MGAEQDDGGDVVGDLGIHRPRDAGRGMYPSGIWSAVAPSMTAAPWEYPPRTILVSGQVATMSRTRLLASVTPSAARGQSRLAG